MIRYTNQMGIRPTAGKREVVSAEGESGTRNPDGMKMVSGVNNN